MKYYRMVLFLLYFGVGLYLVDSSLSFYPIPDVVNDFDDLIILIGGVLVIFHGLTFLKRRRKLIER